MFKVIKKQKDRKTLYHANQKLKQPSTNRVSKKFVAQTRTLLRMQEEANHQAAILVQSRMVSENWMCGLPMNKINFKSIIKDNKKEYFILFLFSSFLSFLFKFQPVSIQCNSSSSYRIQGFITYIVKLKKRTEPSVGKMWAGRRSQTAPLDVEIGTELQRADRHYLPTRMHTPHIPATLPRAHTAQKHAHMCTARPDVSGTAISQPITGSNQMSPAIEWVTMCAGPPRRLWGRREGAADTPSNGAESQPQGCLNDARLQPAPAV